MDLRKLLATALTGSNLKANDNYEAAIDRIGALASATTFGSHLWRVRWCNDANSFDPARTLLAQRMRGAIKSRDIRIKLCTQVLHEWLHDLCMACNGIGSHVVEGTGRTGQSCVPCNGTGIGRHSDQERMRSLGINSGAYYAKWERRFSQAHNIISETDSATQRAVKDALGRISGSEVVAEKVVALAQQASRIKSWSTGRPGHNKNSIREGDHVAIAP